MKKDESIIKLVIYLRKGNPNQSIQPAPLQSIPPCCEPFWKIVIDYLGPLPKKSKENNNLLMIIYDSVGVSVTNRKSTEGKIKWSLANCKKVIERCG